MKYTTLESIIEKNIKLTKGHIFNFYQFIQEEIGATSAEYAIIVSLIAALIVVAVMTFGTNVNLLFELVKF